MKFLGFSLIQFKVKSVSTLYSGSNLFLKHTQAYQTASYLNQKIETLCSVNTLPYVNIDHCIPALYFVFVQPTCNPTSQLLNFRTLLCQACVRGLLKHKIYQLGFFFIYCLTAFIKNADRFTRHNFRYRSHIELCSKGSFELFCKSLFSQYCNCFTCFTETRVRGP